MLEQLNVINQALRERFPTGNDPYQIMTRLLEECGELAQMVHHFEGAGVKRDKHGEPNREHFAKEAQDVLRCVLQLVDHYQLQSELEASVARSYAGVLSRASTQSEQKTDEQ